MVLKLLRKRLHDVLDVVERTKRRMTRKKRMIIFRKLSETWRRVCAIISVLEMFLMKWKVKIIARRLVRKKGRVADGGLGRCGKEEARCTRR